MLDIGMEYQEKYQSYHGTLNYNDTILLKIFELKVENFERKRPLYHHEYTICLKRYICRTINCLKTYH